MTVVGIVIIGIIALFLYFLPTYFSWGRKKNVGAIFALNLLLGWTFLGWLIALIWALTADGNQQIVINTSPTKVEVEHRENISIAEELKKLKGLVEEGILTQSEYEEQKKKLLK